MAQQRTCYIDPILADSRIDRQVKERAKKASYWAEEFGASEFGFMMSLAEGITVIV